MSIEEQNVTGHSREERLAVVKASPAAVAAHDRKAWIDLFARINVVEDPVGSRPHHSGVPDARSGRRGAGPLERFYDTFIAPNEIAFHAQRDIVTSGAVLRQVEIALRMSSGAEARVPMFLVYELVAEAGSLKISRLAAYWELWPMIRQVLGKGRPGIRSMLELGARMMEVQGLGGALGFARGFRGIHGRGKRTLEAFVDAVHARDGGRLAALFHGPGGSIGFPAPTTRLAPASFPDHDPVRLSVSDPISAGLTTAFSFRAEHASSVREGIGLLEFNARSRKLDHADFFWEETPGR